VTHELIPTARRLARINPNRPRQADLKRAVSTAYYALFHTLAQDCADRLIGTGPRRNSPAWVQVYRALEHGFAKNACEGVSSLGFPLEVRDFANTFRQLHDERHRADYDPLARYTRAEVIILVSEAEQAVRSLKAAPREDRSAFAALVLLKRRK